MSLLEPITMPTRGASTSIPSISTATSVRVSGVLWPRSLIARAPSPSHALHGALGDVAPHLLALERDHVGASIRGVPGGARVRPERGHVEDPPARGDEVSVAQGGARVGDLDPGRYRLEARDHV